MADYSASTWKQIDAENTAPAPNGLPEGSEPSKIYDITWTQMGAAKREHDYTHPTVASSGTSTAYVLTYEEYLGYDDKVHSFWAHTENTGPATLNINGLGAKAIKNHVGGDIAVGQIQVDQIVLVVYDGTDFVLQATQTHDPVFTGDMVVSGYITSSSVSDVEDDSDTVATTAFVQDIADVVRGEVAGVVEAALDATIEETSEITKTFVASGAISNAAFVVLRSDGKVEAVTGTETFGSVGTDTTLTVANSLVLLDSAYNAATGKIAVLYYNSTGTNTLYAVVGTVSGTTIAFGTPVTVGTGGTYWNQGKIVWNVAGSTIIVFHKGTSGYPYLRAGSVSGTTITLGTLSAALVATNTDIKAFHHDDTNGSRVIAWDEAGITAATYVGTTLTVGTRAAFTMSVTSNPQCYYDAPNARGILVAHNTTALGSKAFTVSGTTITVGTEEGITAYPKAFCFDPVSGKVLVVTGTGASATPQRLYARVITYSGANSAFSAESTLTFNAVSVSVMHMVYDVDSGKYVLIAQPRFDTSPPDIPNYGAYVLTVSGTTVTISDIVPLTTLGASIDYVLTTNSGPSKVVVRYKAADDFSRTYVTTGKVVSGVFVQGKSERLRNIVATNTATSGATSMMAGSTLVDLGQYSTSSAVMTVFAYTPPTESTNADGWIGIAKATVADAANVSVRVRPAIAKGLSGLTAGTEYYLKGDGTLTTTNNGRRAGIAISATELLMHPKAA